MPPRSLEAHPALLKPRTAGAGRLIAICFVPDRQIYLQRGRPAKPGPSRNHGDLGCGWLPVADVGLLG
jgi:hypothetical protein